MTHATRRHLLPAAGIASAIVVAMSVGASADFEDAPDPGGYEKAIVAVPAAGKSYLGIHEPTILGPSYHGWQPPDIARIADQGGFEIVRFTIDWVLAEPRPDDWDERQWAHYEAAYDALIARGIKPLIGVSNAPPWARDIGLPMLCPTVRLCEYPPRPSMLGEWAEFTAEVARRFPQAAAIEIWNEPNLSNFWKPEPQPERYASLVATAYDAIKARHPDIPVIAGAMAGAPTSRRDLLEGKVAMSLREFLTRAYNARPSIAGHMDGISFHQAVQAIRYGEGTRLAQGFRAVRSVRAELDPRRTPIWLTEFGLSTSDGPRVTPKVQADALLRAYRRVITMRDVRAFVIHTLGGTPDHPLSERAKGEGIIEAFQPFVPKPAYCAFAGRLRHPDPVTGCKQIRESRVSQCSRSMSKLTRAIALALPGPTAELRRRYRQRAAQCVPGKRKLALLKRALARAPKGDIREARKLLTRRRRELAPCFRKLEQIERSYTRAIPTLRLDFLNRHERVRRNCR